jgi:asparagine synthase (glutamine-hydrolysing)
VSVSGGLDSAYIFSIAARLVRDGAAPCPGVLGFNYSGAPGTPSDEEHYVRAIEQSCGICIERIPQRVGFLRFAADETWHSESPLGEALTCQRQAMFRRISAAGAGRLLTGHWGDQMLFDTDYLVDLCRSRQWDVLRQHSNAWGINGRRLALRVAADLVSRHFPASLLGAARRVRRRTGAPWRATWYTKRFKRILRERFEESRLPRQPGTSHAWAIYQQSRRGYHVRCMEWNSRVAAMHGLEIAFPYLDKDLVQFLMSIPGEIQSHEGVPRGLMRHAMRGRVPDAVVYRRSKGEFTQLANRSIELDFPAIADMLGPSSLAVRFGYLDGAQLWPLLAEWKKSVAGATNAALANRVLELCGMELLLREFTTPRREREMQESQVSVAEC